MKEVYVQGPSQRPTPRSVERGKGSFGKAELVSIAAANGGIPWMEVGFGFQEGPHPDVVRQGSVQGPMELFRSPSDREGQSHDLPRSMDAAVCPTGSNHGAPCTGEAQQRRLHFPLDGAAPGLELPPQEIGAVVVDGQTESTFGFWVHADKVEERGGTSRKGWTGQPWIGYR